MNDRTNRRDDGFTLAELLVALAVIAILSVYCLASLRRIQDIRKVEALIAQNEERGSGRAFLRKMISGARLSSTTSAAGTRFASLQGESQSLTIANTLDDRLVRGGIYHLTFSFDDGASRLNLVRTPLGEDSLRAAGEIFAVLIELTDVRFQYFGKANAADDKSWHATWQNPWLPDAVKIDLKFKDDNSEAPDSLLVPLMTAN